MRSYPGRLLLDPAAFKLFAHESVFLLYCVSMIPERELWLAVLYRAICDLAGSFLLPADHSSQPLIRSHAESWLLSPRTDEGSFIWICDHFDLDPASVRRRAFALSGPQFKRRHRHVPSFTKERIRPIGCPRTLDSEENPTHKELVA